MEANDRFTATPPLDRRAQIVRAACQLFWEKGYHGASMRDIGERVGMLKGSLYAHVANKEEILLELASTTFRRLLEAVGPLIERPMPAEDRLRTAVRAHAAIVLGDPAAACMFFSESRHLSGEPAAWARDAYHRYLSIWERIVRAGVESGEFRPDLDVQAASLLVISLDGWARWPAIAADADVASIANRFSALLLLGCRAELRSGSDLESG